MHFNKYQLKRITRNFFAFHRPMPFLKWIEGIVRIRNVRVKMLEGKGERAIGSLALTLMIDSLVSKTYSLLTQFGNTCYSNSVVQALYYCKPFRDCAIRYSYPHSAVKLVLQEENMNVDQLLETAVKPKEQYEGNATKKNDLDAPLESAGSTQQVDAGASNVSDMWKGTTAQQVVQHFGIDNNSDNMLGAIQNLFVAISSQKKQTGVIGPRQFITKLKQENGSPLLIRNI
jgi:hypothetical protein